MKQNENQAKLSEDPYIKCSPDPQTYYRSGKNPLIRGSKASLSQELAWHEGLMCHLFWLMQYSPTKPVYVYKM